MFESEDCVLMLPKQVCHADGKIIELKHPKESQACLVYFNGNSSILYELYKVKEKQVSWFVNDSVVGDTKLSISTPLDPLFMIIPYLVQSRNRFCPLDQILVDEMYPSVIELENLITEDQLSLVGEVKSSSDKIVRFDKIKTIEWLVKKVTNVVQQLKDSEISPGLNSALTDDDYNRYACGIVSDYISASLSSDLHENLGLQVMDYEMEKPSKKIKLSNKNDVDLDKAVKPIVHKGKEKAPKTAKTQKNDAKGMKSMAAFFKKIEK